MPEIVNNPHCLPAGTCHAHVSPWSPTPACGRDLHFGDPQTHPRSRRWHPAPGASSHLPWLWPAGLAGPRGGTQRQLLTPRRLAGSARGAKWNVEKGTSPPERVTAGGTVYWDALAEGARWEEAPSEFSGRRASGNPGGSLPAAPHLLTGAPGQLSPRQALGLSSEKNLRAWSPGGVLGAAPARGAHGLRCLPPSRFHPHDGRFPNARCKTCTEIGPLLPNYILKVELYALIKSFHCYKNY